MYRRRKGRPGRWIAVLLIICGLGGIYWMTKSGPSSLQADGDQPTMLTLDGGSTSQGTSEPKNGYFVDNTRESDPIILDLDANSSPVEEAESDGNPGRELETAQRTSPTEIAAEIEPLVPTEQLVETSPSQDGSLVISEYASLAMTDPIAARAGLTSLIASGTRAESAQRQKPVLPASDADGPIHQTPSAHQSIASMSVRR